MSAIQSNKPSAELVALVERHFELLADAMETWLMLQDEEPEYRQACADEIHQQAESVLAEAQRKAQEEGVDLWETVV